MSWSDPCSDCGRHRADCECGDWNNTNKEEIIKKQPMKKVCGYQKIFKKTHRIVTDEFGGYEVQEKIWWLPFWVQCSKDGGPTNTFSSIEQAKKWVEDGKTPKKKFISKVVCRF